MSGCPVLLHTSVLLASRAFATVATQYKERSKLKPAEPGLPWLSESFVLPREFEDGSFALRGWYCNFHGTPLDLQCLWQVSLSTVIVFEFLNMEVLQVCHIHG